MSSLRIRRVVLPIAALLLVLTACGTSESDSGTDVPSESDSGTDVPSESDSGTDVPSDFRAVVLFPGPSNDLSWGNAVGDGAAAADSLAGISVVSVGGLNTPDEYLEQAVAYANEGYNFVFIPNGSMGQVGAEVATQFPDVQVCVAPVHPATDADLESLPENMCYMDLEQGDANFLAGVLAGLVTETNTIGGIGGYTFPALTRQIEAFHLGARCVNPDVKMVQEYINSWDDTGLAQSATVALISQGADVIVGATNEAVRGTFGPAREAPNKVWIVPEYFDQYKVAPDVVLTSILYDLEGATRELIVRASEGGIEPRSFVRFAFNDLNMRLAPFYDNEATIGADNLAILKSYIERLSSGDITVPDETVGDYPLGTVGMGASVPLSTVGC